MREKKNIRDYLWLWACHLPTIKNSIITLQKHYFVWKNIPFIFPIVTPAPVSERLTRIYFRSPVMSTQLRSSSKSLGIFSIQSHESVKNNGEHYNLYENPNTFTKCTYTYILYPSQYVSAIIPSSFQSNCTFKLTFCTCLFQMKPVLALIEVELSWSE